MNMQAQGIRLGGRLFSEQDAAAIINLAQERIAKRPKVRAEVQAFLAGQTQELSPSTQTVLKYTVAALMAQGA